MLATRRAHLHNLLYPTLPLHPSTIYLCVLPRVICRWTPILTRSPLASLHPRLTSNPCLKTRIRPLLRLLENPLWKACLEVPPWEVMTDPPPTLVGPKRIRFHSRLHLFRVESLLLLLCVANQPRVSQDRLQPSLPPAPLPSPARDAVWSPNLALASIFGKKMRKKRNWTTRVM